MKVSFLITYYNQQQYVSQSIESVLAIRKPCEWEILVGDDGSSDGTADIVRAYMKKYPKHIFLYVMPRDQEKTYSSVQRASANRLNLLMKATGDLFCVLDGDDCYCDTGFVEDALRIFEEHDDASVVMFGYKYVKNGIDGQSVVLPERYDRKRVDKGEYLNSMYVPGGACVHRKAFDWKRMALLNQIGFFDDNDIVINSLECGEPYSVCRVIYAYQQTDISVYNSMNEIEKAVLNVQGYDVDAKLLGECYQKNLWNRNADMIITMYIWKNQLKKLLGENKWRQYVDGCSGIGESLCKDFLCFNMLEKEKRWKIRSFVWQLMAKKKKGTIKQCLRLIKYKLRG